MCNRVGWYGNARVDWRRMHSQRMQIPIQKAPYLCALWTGGRIRVAKGRTVPLGAEGGPSTAVNKLAPECKCGQSRKAPVGGGNAALCAQSYEPMKNPMNIG